MQLKRTGIMLCYPATEKRLSKWEQPFFSQPKLNGERCIVEWFHRKPILVSSYGNQFLGLEHIEEAIFKLPNWLSFDGELYVHGWPREKIHSVVSRKKAFRPESKEMEFHIFDYKCRTNHHLQWERVDMLYTMTDKLKFPLSLVPTQLATMKTWQQHCADYTEQGYEGAIYRQAHALYSEKRSTAIAKFKPTFSDTYTIIDLKEATTTETETQEAGIPLTMVGSFLLKAKGSEQQFYVGSGKLTHSQRKAIWQQHLEGSITGKQLKIKHEKITTTNGIPVCCVALEVI